MTRLEFGLGQKATDGEEKKAENLTTDGGQQTEAMSEIDLIDGANNDEKNPDESTNNGEEKIDMGGGSDEASVVEKPMKTMDWALVRRVALGQMVLATMSIGCLLITLIVGGITWFKFATFFWSTFVMLTGYAGYRSYSTKNYYYVLTFLIMAAFQSLTNWFALVYSSYAVYYFDARTPYYYKGSCLGVSYRDMALFLELTESLTMMGTVITGILGAKACVAGLGRLLTYQDQLIQKRAAWQP